MVIQQHEITLLIPGVEAARCIAQQKAADTQRFQYPHGKSDLLHAVALIIMEPALQNDHFLSPQPADDQLPLVGFDSGMGEMRDILIGDLLLNIQLADEGTETG